jgi:glycerol-3-phosphate dehydrogenase (NAD(P)+)
MRIGVLGLGMWGFCLARHLALQGHSVIGWTLDTYVADLLLAGKEHPTCKKSLDHLPLSIVSTMNDAILDVDMIVESVTTKGLRKVFSSIKKIDKDASRYLILTSKGIEQGTCLTPPGIAEDIFGPNIKEKVAVLSGPSFAAEVSLGLPAAVVCGTKNAEVAKKTIEAFSSQNFRVYPNSDILGVSFGGALKNIIAIACGISEGLHLGVGARAALVTRGLHEMVKLAVSQGCEAQTLYGLSGLGDLYLTCSSMQSRNFQFGQLLSSGLTQKEAEKKVAMVVEGAYTCRAALSLAEKCGIPMPITQAVCDLLDGKLTPSEVTKSLMQRDIKEERL